MPRNEINTRLEMHAAEPLYKQVEKQILTCLAHGEWKPGDRIPTESQLAQRFGVAVLTVRAGIRDLVEANILVRKQGSGTFVARHDRQRQRYQFTHVFHNHGIKAMPMRRLLSFSKAAADKSIAARLMLETRASVFRIDCLMELDTPIATMEIAVPARMFSGLTARAIEKSQENLYAIYQQVCGVNVIRIAERVHAVKAGARTARALRMDAADPVMLIDRIAYTYDDVPVEFRRRIHNAADFHYELDEGGI